MNFARLFSKRIGSCSGGHMATIFCLDRLLGFSSILVSAFALGSIAFLPTLSLAQNAENQATQDAGVQAAIKAVTQAGGRVYRISAVDDWREVSFYLSDKPIGDAELAQAAKIDKIRWMNLANTKITNKGLASLAGMTDLMKLHLEKTSITDEGLKHLKNLQKLEYLNLYGSNVSDAGLVHLTGLKNLKRLYVWKTKVTQAGMDSLNEKLPKLKIVGEAKFTPVKPPMPEKKDDPKKDEQKKEEGKDKTIDKNPEKVPATAKPKEGKSKKDDKDN